MGLCDQFGCRNQAQSVRRCLSSGHSIFNGTGLCNAWCLTMIHQNAGSSQCFVCWISSQDESRKVYRNVRRPPALIKKGIVQPRPVLRRMFSIIKDSSSSPTGTERRWWTGSIHRLCQMQTASGGEVGTNWQSRLCDHQAWFDLWNRGPLWAE